MASKTTEAALIGFSIWAAGALALLLFGQEPFFPPAAIPAALLLAPLMYLITKLHLRNVPAKERANAAMLLGVVAAAVQFPLDALGLYSIFKLGYPPLSTQAREAAILAMEIAYFLILTVPLLSEKNGR